MRYNSTLQSSEDERVDGDENAEHMFTILKTFSLFREILLFFIRCQRLRQHIKYRQCRSK